MVQLGMVIVVEGMLDPSIICTLTRLLPNQHFICPRKWSEWEEIGISFVLLHVFPSQHDRVPCADRM